MASWSISIESNKENKTLIVFQVSLLLQLTLGIPISPTSHNTLVTQNTPVQSMKKIIDYHIILNIQDIRLDIHLDKEVSQLIALAVN